MKCCLKHKDAAEMNAAATEVKFNAHTHHEHIHMQCRACGKILHPNVSLWKRLSGIQRPLRFTLNAGSVLMGMCESCQISQDNKRSIIIMEMWIFTTKNRSALDAPTKKNDSNT